MATATAVRRGMISGVYNTARLVGGTLGLAVMGALLATFEAAELENEEVAEGQTRPRWRRPMSTTCSRGGDAKGIWRWRGCPAASSTRGGGGVRAVFDYAFSTTLKLSTLVVLAGALVAYAVIPRLRAHSEEQEPLEFERLQPSG